MRILLFSDTHCRCRRMEEAVASRLPGAGLLCHLGDCLEDGEGLRRSFPQVPVVALGGNCDFGRGPQETVLEVEGVRLFLTHGHRYGVKSGTERLEQEARQAGCQAVAFGHTHMPLCEYRDGLWLLNPGSVSQPREGRPSFLMLDLTPAGIVPLPVSL